MDPTTAAALKRTDVGRGEMREDHTRGDTTTTKTTRTIII